MLTFNLSGQCLVKCQNFKKFFLGALHICIMSNNIPQFIGDANSWERFTKAGLFEFQGKHSTC